MSTDHQSTPKVFKYFFTPMVRNEEQMLTIFFTSNCTSKIDPRAN